MAPQAPHATVPTTPRQAVVLIHGIGEQKPMSTLRSFVTGLGYTDFRNKPDRFSDGFELRRITLNAKAPQSPVDFFEFYWSHHLAQGQLRQTLMWAVKLVARRPFWKHDRGLFGAIAVAQITFMFVLGFVVWGFVSALIDGDLSETFKQLSSTVGVIALILNLIAGGFITNALADAPRYLTPSPANVVGRNTIRAEGVALLRSLHESGDYQRIVVVGHSLGSMIGFDLIRLLWDEMRHPDPLQPSGLDKESKVEAAATVVRQATTDNQDDLAAEWQEEQHQLWRECRARGMAWLITDFVTLGSPLAHGSFLLEPSSWWHPSAGPALRVRQQEQEVPTCPPDEKCGRIFRTADYRDPAGGSIKARVAHTAAPFAVTRWTNLYFPIKLWHGDPVGGPVAPEFGNGVRDIKVRTHPQKAHTLSGLYLRSHVRYWRADELPGLLDAQKKQEKVDGKTNTTFAVSALKDTLALQVEDYPPSDPVSTRWPGWVPPVAPAPVTAPVTPGSAPDCPGPAAPVAFLAAIAVLMTSGRPRRWLSWLRSRC